MELESKLLAIAGNRVIPPRFMLARLLAHGGLFTEPVSLRPGIPGSCHGNTVALINRYGDDGAQFATGFGLRQGDWRQHSWGVWRGRIIESTTQRDLYFGMILSPPAAREFLMNWLAGFPFDTRAP